MTRWIELPALIFTAFQLGCAAVGPSDRHPAQAVEAGPVLSFVNAQDQMHKILNQGSREFLSMVLDGRGLILNMKKWTLSGNSFLEKATTSTDDEKNWYVQSVDFQKALPSKLWFGGGAGAKRQIQFRATSANSFELISISNLGVEEHAYIFPAHTNPFPAPMLVSFNHFSAPVALNSAVLLKGDGLNTDFMPPVTTTVLRHDLSTMRPVYLDSSFPAEFQDSVKGAIEEWNHAYKQNFYVLAGQRNLTRPWCLMNSVLCIFWNGSNHLALSGFGAVTADAYDPETGLIGGGIITFSNNNQLDTLTPLPADQVEALKDARSVASHMDLVAKLSIAVDRTQYASADPVRVIRAVLIHEMGHDTGMRHYFMGSVFPDRNRSLLSDTVMDYMPAVVFQTMDRLGQRDLDKINEIYFNGPPVHEIGCSDPDLIVDPYCKPQDLGATEDWLIRLAGFAPAGILTNYNELGGILMLVPDMAGAPIYQRLEQFILPDVQTPVLPQGTPESVAKETRQNYAKIRSDFLAQVAFLHKGISESVSRKVKEFLCTPKQLALVKQGAPANKFADLKQVCFGIPLH